MAEMQEKMKRLPCWARELIERLEIAAEPNKAELRLLRQRVVQAEQRERKLRERVDAMTEILTCAARGGHETAKEYVERIINEYTTDDQSEV